MSRPNNLTSKIFLDSGDPQETKKALEILGFLDGQTTNPSLVGKNPEVQKRIVDGKKFTSSDLFNFYKEVVIEISNLIPQGSVSIEVYADKFSTKSDLLAQAEEMYKWIDNAHIKFPTIAPGLEAAEEFLKAGGRVNMTLCFSQEQGAGVYSATKGAKKGEVFYSSFIGRLFDNGVNGITQVKNVIDMYKNGDGHVEVLAASFRNLDQFLASLYLQSDIITMPFKIIEEWKTKDLLVPTQMPDLEAEGINEPFYEEIDLDKPWREYNIQHDLTDAGLNQFAKDWNSLIA